MDPQVFQLLLAKRHVAYLITNRNMLITDAGGNDKLWTCSSTSQEIGGVPIGHPLLDLIPELVESRTGLNRILLGTEHRNQIDYVRNDSGRKMFVRVTTVARRDRAGQVVGLLHVLEDISEIGHMRHTIEQLQRHKQTLQSQLDIAAHELGTPLTLIAGYLDLMKEAHEELWGAEEALHLHQVMANMERLMVIANDLFDMMYADEGQLRLALQALEVGPLLRAVVDSFQPLLQPRKQRVRMTIPEELPLVVGDWARVTQIVRTLLTNASCFSPHNGEIQLKARTVDDAFVQISVIDNGVGIHPYDKEKVFERFYRSRLADQTAPSGAGLGLYIARILVELHGGRIWCDNSHDAGAVFAFTLPIGDIASISMLPTLAKPILSDISDQSRSVLTKSYPPPVSRIPHHNTNRPGFSGH